MRSFLKKMLILAARQYIKISSKISKIFGAAHASFIKDKGVNCIFEGACTIIKPEKVHLGDDVWIGRNCFMHATGGIRIGNYTHISRNVVIHTVNHNANGDKLPYDRNDISCPVTIGDYVWVGMNVNILPGVSIGNGAIIGMGTTVSKDVMPGQVVVGSPQRVVKNRDPERTEELVSRKAFLRNL